MPKKNTLFKNSIKDSIYSSMKKNKNVILMGLGVDDPKGIFGTTLDLNKKFPNRVYDLPTAENGFTGFAIGLALSGKKPIITHQRVEFSLLSIDQLFNQAAKWNYMTAGDRSVPMVIRLIIGKGWGQGPQHSQSLESVFSHIPGLKVVCPSNPYNAKGLLTSSIEDKNPVIFFEHRWLHETYGYVPKNNYKVKIGQGKIIKKGSDLTLICFSLTVLECLKASKILSIFNVNVEILDLQTLRPLDKNLILKSVKKTKKVIVVDNGWSFYGISSEILALIQESNISKTITAKRVGLKNTSIPSSKSLAKHVYPTPFSIVKLAEKILKRKFKNLNKFNEKEFYSDQPYKNFLGPF